MTLIATIAPKGNKWKLFASLFIKSAVLLGTFGYISHKVFHNQNIDQIKLHLQDMFDNASGPILLALVAVLMLFNWGLEAAKWKFLLRKIETISFAKSLKSIFAGACVSIFTPNRLGEFGGRIFYLKPSNRVHGVMITFLGNLGQLTAAITTGVIGSLLFLHFFRPFIINEWGWQIALGTALVCITTLYALIFNLHKAGTLIKLLPKWMGINIKKRWGAKWISCANLFHQYTHKDIYWLLFLSALRFGIYCIQFYVLLQATGISMPIIQGMVLITMCFFTLTIVPTISLSELGIRGSVAIFFIGHLSPDSLGILTASFLLWVINLVIPAILGSYFVYRIKLFSTSVSKEKHSSQTATVQLG